MKKIRLVILLILLIMTVASCGKEDNSGSNDNFKDNYYTVTFDTQGANVIQSQSVKSGEKIVKPKDPSKNGYTFLGWYLGDEEWSFVGYVVTENITLTAKWSIESSIGLEYTLNRDGTAYWVSGIGTCAETNVIVADIYNGLPVQAVGNYAFEGCKTLTNIVLPNSILSIGNNAFEWCTGLIEITIPNSVVNIGSCAFLCCENLEKVILSNNITILNERVFCQCKNLKEINLPSKLTKIDSKAFYTCRSLENIVIPTSVIELGDDAFAGCNNLAQITYCGSESNWNSIRKGEDWDSYLGSKTSKGTYTIKFTD